MANEQEEIGRDALEMSGLRASLQRRHETPRKAKDRASTKYRTTATAEYLRAHGDAGRPPMNGILVDYGNGVSFVVVYE